MHSCVMHTRVYVCSCRDPKLTLGVFLHCAPLTMYFIGSRIYGLASLVNQLAPRIRFLPPLPWEATPTSAGILMPLLQLVGQEFFPLSHFPSPGPWFYMSSFVTAVTHFLSIFHS